MADSCSTSGDTEKELLETALNLAKENPAAEVVKNILTAKQDDLKVSKLKETLAHVLFHVTIRDNNSTFVVKKIKKERENDTIEKERLALEAKNLIKLQKLVPGLSPAVFCWSEKLGCMALEDFSSYKSLGSELTSGDVNKETIHQVAETVAQLHKATHVNNGRELFAKLEKEFQNGADPLLLSLSNILNTDVERLEPGRLRDVATRFLTSNQSKATVSSLIESAKSKKEALLHGRLVGDSILIHGEEIKLIDGDSLFVGPCAFDVGRLLAQYLSCYYEHMLTEENNDWHRKISYLMVDAANDTMEHYLSAIGETLQGREEFVSDVAAYSGLELVNRALKSIPETSKSLEILEAGIRLLHSYHRIRDGGRLVVIALMLTL